MALGSLNASPEEFGEGEAMPIGQDIAVDQPDEQEQDPVARLQELMSAPNIAELLSEEELASIGDKAVRMFDIDKASRGDLDEMATKVMDLARQVTQEKTYPWAGAANVIYPLISEAAIQFNARAYPAIVDGKAVVKGKIQGRDPNGQKQARADRVSRYMTYQLIEQEEEWEGDTDRLLIMLPITGDMFRKVWFDRELGRNRSEILGPDMLIINQNVRSLARAPRATQLCEYYPHEIYEKIAKGEFRQFEYGMAQEANGDEDAPHKFIEQQCRIDLDKDGYAEPYAVTVHLDTHKVVAIVACFRQQGVQLKRDGGVAWITPETYYIHYQFMPDPNGGFHGMGLGRLLYSTNKAINSLLNILFDSGHMAALGGGFIGKGATVGAGKVSFTPNEWKKVESSGAALKDNIVPLPVREPSAVLFNLLGLLIESGKSLAATKDILTGESSQNMTASLGLALIEQGLKVFTSIYKRVHRAMHDELKLRYHLNSLYTNPQTYFTFQDEEQQVTPEDFAEGDLDVVPVTDPSVVTDMQRMAKAQWLSEVTAESPFVNQQERLKRLLEAGAIENVDKLINPEPPPEDPRIKTEALKMASDIELNRAQSAKIWKELGLIDTQAILNLANAEAAEAGTQLDEMGARWDRLVQINQALEQEKVNQDAGQNHAAGIDGVAPPPDNAEGMAVPE